MNLDFSLNSSLSMVRLLLARLDDIGERCVAHFPDRSVRSPSFILPCQTASTFRPGIDAQMPLVHFLTLETC